MIELLTSSNWPHQTIKCNRDDDSMYAWFPGEVIGDITKVQRLREILHASNCFGVIEKITPDTNRARSMWGRRLGTGKEGSVFRPTTHDEFAVKIFKSGKGVQQVTSDAIELDVNSSRAGRGVVIHNVLADLFEGSKQIHVPKAHGLLIDPQKGRAITVLDFVEGDVVTDSEATRIAGIADDYLSKFGIDESLRSTLLHDVHSNGGNVLAMPDGRFSIIDR